MEAFGGLGSLRGDEHGTLCSRLVLPRCLVEFFEIVKRGELDTAVGWAAKTRGSRERGLK